MKVVIINQFTTGGAAKAAMRLNNALNQNGIQSNVLSIASPNGPNIYSYNNFSIISRISRFLPSFYKQNKYQKIKRTLPFSNSFPEAVYDITDHPLIQGADIINLHWVGEMINYKSFFRKAKKPIVWTLHDMNPFMGCAHYQYDLDCHNEYQPLDNRIQKLKFDAISKNSNLSVVSLCNWMKEKAEKSMMFNGRSHLIIPNSLDTNVFRLYDRESLRKGLGFNAAKPVIMFCSEILNDRRKGFDILLDATKLLRQDIQYLVVGRKSNEIPNHPNFRFFGPIHDELTLAMLYSCADLFVIPSREDNLPNTMLESLCCGTPIVSFSNGGMRDTIRNWVNGLLVNEMTPTALAKAIKEALARLSEFDNIKIYKDAVSKFNPSVQAQAYINLFMGLI